MKESKHIGCKLLIAAAVIFIARLIVTFLVPIPLLENTVPPQQLADPDSLYASIDGIDTHYKNSGQGETALLQLHGFPSSLFTLRKISTPLSVYYQVVSYDRPAFGLTDRLLEWQSNNPHSISDQTLIAVMLLDQLGIERAVLVENSTGGRIATEIALKHPERVNALILISPPANLR